MSSRPAPPPTGRTSVFPSAPSPKPGWRAFDDLFAIAVTCGFLREAFSYSGFSQALNVDTV